jgi:hypothetical protein
MGCGSCGTSKDGAPGVVKAMAVVPAAVVTG